MKKTLLFALSLMMLVVFAVGCSTKDETADNAATAAPVATEEVSAEATQEALVETTDEAPVEEATEMPSEAGSN